MRFFRGSTLHQSNIAWNFMCWNFLAKIVGHRQRLNFPIRQRRPGMVFPTNYNPKLYYFMYWILSLLIASVRSIIPEVILLYCPQIWILYFATLFNMLIKFHFFWMIPPMCCDFQNNSIYCTISKNFVSLIFSIWNKYSSCTHFYRFKRESSIVLCIYF